MQTNLNYEEELKKLQDSSNFWKPKQGKYSIKVLREPEETTWSKEGGEVVQQWKLYISVAGSSEIVWTVPKSYSPSSIRGQLIRLALKSNKSLTNVSFTLLVMGEGKERRYTIPELL